MSALARPIWRSNTAKLERVALEFWQIWYELHGTLLQPRSIKLNVYWLGLGRYQNSLITEHPELPPAPVFCYAWVNAVGISTSTAFLNFSLHWVLTSPVFMAWLRWYRRSLPLVDDDTDALHFLVNITIISSSPAFHRSGIYDSEYTFPLSACTCWIRFAHA